MCIFFEKPCLATTLQCTLPTSEVGIYKRKQESKKTRKQELDQESDQENKKKRKIILFFLLSYFLAFFYKFPSLYVQTF